MIKEYYKAVNADYSDLLIPDLFWHPQTIVETEEVTSASSEKPSVPTIVKEGKIITLKAVPETEIKNYSHIQETELFSSTKWEITDVESDISEIFGPHGSEVLNLMFKIDKITLVQREEVAKIFNTKMSKKELSPQFLNNDGAHKVAKKTKLTRPFMFIVRNYEAPYREILSTIMLQDYLAAQDKKPVILELWSELSFVNN